MWFKKTAYKKVISIILEPTYLVCAYLEFSTKNQPCILHAHQRITLTQTGLNSNIIFNPTMLKTYIQTFIDSNQTDNAYVVFAMRGPCIVEEMVTFDSSTPQQKDFIQYYQNLYSTDEVKLDSSYRPLQKMIWDYLYLYPTGNGFFRFYFTGMPPELLFQYKLFFRALKLNIITLTTPLYALLHVYKQIQGSSFRQSQLGYDMEFHKHRLEKICTPDTIARLINTRPAQLRITTQNAVELATLVGLYLTNQ